MSEKKELIDLLNALLEAERAGVETANHLIKDYQIEELKAQYKQLKQDEAWSCAGLHKSIVREGGVPSMQVGDFIDKITALETLEDKLKLLIKGQAWVARKIDLAISFGAHPETEAFLIEMKEKHDVNIGELENYLQEK
jgi:bacterioferritin (cytochrome b1)